MNEYTVSISLERNLEMLQINLYICLYLSK
jgi:hypothetical protein